MEFPYQETELDGQLRRDLFTNHDVYMTGEFNEARVDAVVRQLTALDYSAHAHMGNPEAFELVDPKWEDFRIRLHISSYGGSVYEFLRLYDCIQSLSVPVDTIAEGKAMSAGAFLLLSGSGVRSVHMNAHVMLHTIQTWAAGDLNDIEEDLSETRKLEQKLKTIVKKHTGLDTEQVNELFTGDNYITPTQAKALGLIDYIIRPTPSNKRKNWR